LTDEIVVPGQIVRRQNVQRKTSGDKTSGDKPFKDKTPGDKISGDKMSRDIMSRRRNVHGTKRPKGGTTRLQRQTVQKKKRPLEQNVQKDKTSRGEMSFWDIFNVGTYTVQLKLKKQNNTELNSF
jgi:hypothetical protein